ncbi:hypothetical protein [Nocardia sp. IFM 10818]
MSANNVAIQQEWFQRKPDAEFAVRALLSQLEKSDEDPRAIMNGYVFAKRALAASMQVLIRTQILDEEIAKFRELHGKVQAHVTTQYKERISDRFLNVPYNSHVHEQLFALLYQRIGEAVDAELLRIVTADSVHTERRTRELRELGLDIAATKIDEINVYTLRSLEIDYSLSQNIVKNNIRKHRELPVGERDRLLSKL